MIALPRLSCLITEDGRCGLVCKTFSVLLSTHKCYAQVSCPMKPACLCACSLSDWLEAIGCEFQVAMHMPGRLMLLRCCAGVFKAAPCLQGYAGGVDCYTSENSIKPEMWGIAIKCNKALVMTAQVFLNMLEAGVAKPLHFSLMVS